MSLGTDGSAARPGALGIGSGSPPKPRFARPAKPSPNSVRVSQARAALRREARRDELAVAHWLRELAGRPR
jgi:hypothetical protein